MEDSEARKRLDEVESRTTVLEESVNKAVATLMPKVEALLVERSDGEEASFDSHTSTSASASTSLVEMAKRGDYESLLRMLVVMDIDKQKYPQRTENGETALHVAASGGHLKAVLVLLGAGAEINARGHWMRTPLHCAAAQGHLAVAQRLLNNGANVDIKDADENTPLNLALGQGSWGLVNLLLQKGAQPNEKAVSTAVDWGNWDVVELLLLNGRSFVDTCNKERVPIIVLAAKANHWEMVQLLLEYGASARKCKTDEESALALASQAGQADVVRQLLLRGAASNAKQVQWAAQEANCLAVVRAFVDVVPNKIRESLGEECLKLAATRGRLEALVAFLETGVNINATDYSNCTALHHAVSNGHLACVRELLNRGANVLAKNNLNNTPLHEASSYDHVECVRALLDAGARRFERNNQGMTPREIARSYDVCALLS